LPSATATLTPEVVQSSTPSATGPTPEPTATATGPSQTPSAIATGPSPTVGTPTASATSEPTATGPTPTGTRPTATSTAFDWMVFLPWAMNGAAPGTEESRASAAEAAERFHRAAAQ
jgi:hypothetical protein